MLISKNNYGIRAVTWVASLIFFIGFSTFGQSDTTFLRLVGETEGQILKNYNKATALTKIDRAFQILLKEKKWDKIYDCAYAVYYLKQENLVSSTESVIIIENQLKKMPLQKAKLIGKFYHLIYYILYSSGKVHNSLLYAMEAQIKYNLDGDSITKSRLFNTLCVTYIQLRDFKQAVAYAKQAVSFGLSGKKLTRQYSTQNLGLAYLYSGDGFLGRQFLEKSREISVSDYTSYYKWISESYQAEGDNVCAMIYADSSLQYALKNNEANLAFAYARKGEIYLSNKNYSSALSFFHIALKKAFRETNPRELAKILLPLAQCEMQLGYIDAAQRHIDQGIALIGPNIAKLKSAKKENIPMAMADMYYLDFLYENSLLQWTQYKKTKDQKYLREAIKQLSTYTEFSAQMKTFFSNYGAKRDLAVASKKGYALMMEAHYELYLLSKNNDHKEKAFVLSQEYNSFTLREQMNERNALIKTIKNEKLIERYFSLKRNYLDAIESAWTDTLTHDMFTVTKWKQDFKNYSDSLEKKFPTFKKFKSGLPIAGSKEIMASLKQEDAFISYFIGDTSIFAFTITKDQFTFTKIRKPLTFESDVNSYLETLAKPINRSLISETNATILSKGHLLYKSLFNDIPLPKNIKSLIIVPDGPLYRLPFESLIKDQAKSLATLDGFLIASFDIRYLYYAAQFLEKSRSSQTGVLALGLEYDKFTLSSMKEIKKEEIPDWLSSEFRSESMAHLYFSDDEAIKVAELYSGDAFVNQHALPENFEKNAPDYGLLHVSAHSYVDYVSPDQSAIILTKKDSTHDNLLTSENIEALNLNANLVTLSSCNSSSGALSEGEGVSSLTKSFFTAGCKSVIGSHWSVSDQITSIMMERFYLHLQEGNSKSEALRLAKLDILDDDLNLVNPAYRHPSFWAAWTLYGANDTIAKPTTKTILIMLGILGLSILLVAYITWEGRSIIKL